MAVPLQYSGNGAGQSRHHFLVPPFRCVPFFPAGLLRRFPFFTTDPFRCCQVFPAGLLRRFPFFTADLLRRCQVFPAGLLRRFPFFTADLLRGVPFFTTDPLCRCQVFPAGPFGFCPVFPSFTATVSAVKVVSQQLRYSKDGQHYSDVCCALKVL